MPASSEFAELVRELLAPLGDVRAKRMFGGFGLYHGDTMFALIADDTLYFRTDERTRPTYEEAGLPRFHPFPDKPSFARKPAAMPYHRPPDSVLDDGEEMLAWARPALDAALRAKTGKRKAS